MGFHEVRIDDRFGYGSRGGPGMATLIVETDSGQEERVGRWDDARRRYDMSEAIKDPADLFTLQKFFLARKGALNGFRFKDHIDFTSADDGQSAHAIDDQLIGTGTGSKTTFQLVKRYASGAQTITRNIRKPVASTELVELDGAPQATPADYTIDTATGIITFVVAPPLGEDVKAGFEFDVPVRFEEAADKLLSMTIDAFTVGSIPSVPMVELLDESESPDDFFFGGGSAQTIAADTPILISSGRSQDLTYSAPGNIARLPDETNLPLGGPYFFLNNVDANAGDIRDQADNVISAHASSAVLTIILTVAGWVAF